VGGKRGFENGQAQGVGGAADDGHAQRGLMGRRRGEVGVGEHEDTTILERFFAAPRLCVCGCAVLCGFFFFDEGQRFYEQRWAECV
jgi:hypothetical protein